MKRAIVLLVIASFALAIVPVGAQDDMMSSPEVRVQDQFVTDGHVTIEHVYSPGVGWLVVHADNDEGAPGPVIGWRHLHPGQNNDIRVSIDVFAATPVLFAMLHEDTGGPGYDFPNEDPPVMVDGGIVSPAFNIQLVQASPQFLDGDFLADVVVTDAPGWLVIHADNEGRPGPVLGQVLLTPGQNSIVAPFLEGYEGVNRVWPMLHLDTGEAGVYEFGSVEGADPPVMVNGRVATYAVNTAPSIVANPQIIIHGDNVPESAMMMGMGDMDDMSDDMDDMSDDDMDDMSDDMDDMSDDMDDMSDDDMDDMSDDMDDMSDDNMDDMSDDMDDMSDDNMDDMSDDMDDMSDDDMDDMSDDMDDMDGMGSDMMMGDYTFVADVLSDGQGWLVVHADNEGRPGAVLGYSLVDDGFTHGVVVELDGMAITPVVFPMLHTDTGEAGVYEFGSVDGADGPVSVNGNVVTFPVPIAPDWRARPQPTGVPVNIEAVLTDATTWVVIHSVVDGAPGPVLGFKQVSSGLSTNVLVEYDDPSTVEGAALDAVHVMLHYDTGVVGEYEFGMVDGADGPIVVNGDVVTRLLQLNAE